MFLTITKLNIYNGFCNFFCYFYDFFIAEYQTVMKSKLVVI